MKEAITGEIARLASRIAAFDEDERRQRAQRDEIKRAIAENGGDRLESLRKEIADRQEIKNERMGRAEAYDGFARDAGLPAAGDTVTVGITHHAQDELGDIVFVDLPETGRAAEAGASFGSVESVKAVSDIYSPVSGEIVAVNEALRDAPETINKDPYGGGWIAKIKIRDAAGLAGLLDYAAYQKLCAEESH